MYDMISLRYSCAASVPVHIPGIRDAVSRRNKHLLFVFTNVKALESAQGKPARGEDANPSQAGRTSGSSKKATVKVGIKEGT